MWSPHNSYCIKAVELVQWGMTRCIVGNSKTFPKRCEILNILPLSYRCEIIDLTFLYKYLHGKLGVSFSDELQIVEGNSRLGSSNDGMRLYDKFVRTETFKAYYFTIRLQKKCQFLVAMRVQ